MPLVMGHEHEWTPIGAMSDQVSGQAVWVVYECTGCDAWTRRQLDPNLKVPFRMGSVPEKEVDEDGR